MQVICKDNFSYPSLTEGKSYESKFEQGKFMVLDDSDIWRDYPLSSFESNTEIDVYLNGLEEAESEIDDLESEIEDLESELDDLEDQISEIESSIRRKESRISDLKKAIKSTL